MENKTIQLKRKETVDLNDEVIFISISELRKQNVDGGLLI